MQIHTRHSFKIIPYKVKLLIFNALIIYGCQKPVDPQVNVGKGAGIIETSKEKDKLSQALHSYYGSVSPNYDKPPYHHFINLYSDSVNVVIRNQEMKASGKGSHVLLIVGPTQKPDFPEGTFEVKNFNSDTLRVVYFTIRGDFDNITYIPPSSGSLQNNLKIKIEKIGNRYKIEWEGDWNKNFYPEKVRGSYEGVIPTITLK
jgi:hypothetical protein